MLARSAVESGAADVGVGVASAAAAMGLDFIFIGNEEYDFAVDEQFCGNPMLQAFIEALGSDEFSSELKRLDVVLLVDAVDDTGEPPGTLVTFLPEDIAPYEAFHGAHDARFVDVLCLQKQCMTLW